MLVAFKTLPPFHGQAPRRRSGSKIRLPRCLALCALTMLLSMVPAMLLVMFPAALPARAAVVSADTNGGYGAQVMEIILANWVKPAQATGSTSVIVRITTDGRPFSCELRKSSGNPAVDDAICMAVAKAGSFPPAPYAAPAEVALTFLYGAAETSGGAAPADGEATPKTYADTIMENARPHIILPETLNGAHSATVRLTVMPDGTLAEYKMEAPSGSSAFDTAVLRSLLQPGVITPPPDGQQQNVYLTFTLNQN